MKISILRSGGFTGIPRRFEVSSADLTPEEQQELSGLIRSADFWNQQNQVDSTQPGDRFRYTVTIDEAGASKSVVLDEAGMTAHLMALVQRVTALARAHK
jgi:hypothetical protein